MKNVEVKKIKPDSTKILDINEKIHQICASREDVKYLG
jgi:hypothetical protein